MEIKAPRGTYDILPDESYKWQYIESVAREIATLYGYYEIRTPVFEHTELFVRGIGENTDIVNKEMYVFKDKKGRSLTLRPEGTATVVRACIEHNFCQRNLNKLFYIGPFMRYERPQSGRFRQFHQFGLESIGSSLPSLDSEVIQATYDYFRKLGLKELHVEINSIGCRDCRPSYRESLIDFFKGKADELCQDCGNRLKTNPLRVLDCKVKTCREIANVAPSIFGFLCSDCKNHFAKLQNYLDSIKLPFKINPLIVRGLDYYNRTVFEVISSNLGSQDALCGGGRYDQLAYEIGGKTTPAVGVAIGLERTISVMEKVKAEFKKPLRPDVMLIGLGEESDIVVHNLLREMRVNGLRADRDYLGRNLKSQMKEAHHIGVRFVAIIGTDEIRDKSVTLRDMDNGDQKVVPVKDVIMIVQKRME